MDLYFSNRGNGASFSECGCATTGHFLETGMPFEATEQAKHLIGADSTKAEWRIVADAPSGRAHLANLPLTFTIEDISRMTPVFDLASWDSQHKYG